MPYFEVIQFKGPFARIEARIFKTEVNFSVVARRIGGLPGEVYEVKIPKVKEDIEPRRTALALADMYGNGVLTTNVTVTETA